MGNDPHPEDCLLPAESAAYFFAANAEAWKQFCADLNVAPDVLTAANHRGWLLRYCEERMPANAPAAEALLARLPKDHTAQQLVTTESLLAAGVTPFRP